MYETKGCIFFGFHCLYNSKFFYNTSLGEDLSQTLSNKKVFRKVFEELYVWSLYFLKKDTWIICLKVFKRCRSNENFWKKFLNDVISQKENILFLENKTNKSFLKKLIKE